MCVIITFARGLMAFKRTFTCVWGTGSSLLAVGAGVGAVLWGRAQPHLAADPSGDALLSFDSQCWLSGDSLPTTPALLRGVVLKLLHNSSVSWHITAAPDGSHLREPLRASSPCSELPEQENPSGILSALPASSSRKTQISPTVK